MTNTIEIKIQAPSPPEGFEVCDTAIIPKTGMAFDVLQKNWLPIENVWSADRIIAYAIPIPKAKPKTREVWMSEGQNECVYAGKYSVNAPHIKSCQRITLYEGRFDVEGEPTPEERLIELVRKRVLKINGLHNLHISDDDCELVRAYRDLQEMRGETL